MSALLDSGNSSRDAHLSLVPVTEVAVASYAIKRRNGALSNIVSNKLERVRMYLLDDECDRDIKPLQN